MALLWQNWSYKFLEWVVSVCSVIITQLQVVACTYIAVHSIHSTYTYFTPLQDTALSPTYEVEYEPDSNTRSRNQVIFIKILSGLNNSRTPEGYQAYRIDELEQDELYTMHIQEFITGTGVVQLSDQFFLCKYMQFSYTVCNKQNK